MRAALAFLPPTPALPRVASRFSPPRLAARAMPSASLADPPPTIEDAHRALKTHFGHSAFRPGQRRVIEHLLSTPETPLSPETPSSQTGRALAIFPTGAGKSLCYQLPGLLLSGLTLVVSPLLALMKDQVDALRARSHPAACLDSTLSAAETRDLFDEVRAGSIRLLFVSPERFKNARFLRLIQSVSVALFAVDEAHCISEWGHSFRPDYLRLSRWADRLHCRRRLALTATATPAVARDICAALDIPYPHAQVRLPSVRPNLTTRVTSVPPARAPERLSFADALEPRVDLLVARLRERDPGPTIVYVTLQATATVVAEQLRKRGFLQAASYHAGMKSDDRKAVQEAFMENRKNGLVVATIAFGMGMDHSGIRYVYHLNIPKSLEGYIQEIGRAGRDGLPSVCETFAGIDDLPTLEGFCYGETPALSSVQGVIHQLFDDAEKDGYVEYSTYDMTFQFDMRDTCLGQILAQLDLSEELLEESTPFFAEVVCRVDPMKTRKQPPAGSEMGNVYSLGTHKKVNSTFSVREIAKKLDTDYGRISRLLDDMVIEGYFQSATPRKLTHRALVRKMPEDVDAVARRMHAMLLRTQKQQLRRLSQVVEYMSANECQTALLQRHLGDEVEDIGPCGHCEFCLNDGKQPVNMSREARQRVAKTLDVRRWALIRKEIALPRDNPLLLARFASGISSPVIARKYRRLHLYGSMSDHDFQVLLKAAKEECVAGAHA